ncbi:MAG: nucleoside-diphosphate kinase [Candidatus Paceibacteria bacterium]
MQIFKPFYMKKQPNQERSLVLLKTDAVQRSLVGEIVKRFEQTGLKISALKMVEATEKQLLSHYSKDDAWYLKKGEGIVIELKEQGKEVDREPIEYGKDIIRTVVKYMMASPIVALVFEGNKAVSVVTKIVGSTEPSTSDVGTIRGDYTVDSFGHATYENRAVRNLVHQSESPEEAEREINIWFADEEIMKYTTAQERIMYDVNLDGTPE